MQFPFLPEVENVLRTAGWYPGRKVNAAEIARWNRLRPLFPAAQEALEEFAYLYFSWSFEPLWVVHGSFCIDPVEAWYCVGSNEEIDDYESLLGQVYPIGLDGNIRNDGKIEFVSGSMTYFMDGHGRVFADGYDLFLVGNTIQEALTNLILGRNPPAWDFEKDVPKEN